MMNKKKFLRKRRPSVRRPYALCYMLPILWSMPAMGGIDRAVVRRAETYLNGITGLTGSFTQESNGKKDRGEFSMLRPGRVRLDYETSPIQLISNGRDLYFYDKSLDQITTLPLAATPAGILVRKNIDLTNADIVVAETERTKAGFSLKMHIRDNEGIGSMRVDFSDGPVALKSWVVLDATGAETSVVFGGLRAKTDFSKNYFQLQKMKASSNSGGDGYYE